MSLNGLDDPKVKEAHDSAVAEPGGWFLLKYASRDDVELLGRGNGGIVEIRNNIAQYEDENEERSPLFGFLRYRRRNVIIKYLPEDCSRLVQARVTVHFNAVCERFTPYNTTFSIAAAKELKDTKLSAACSLHAQSGSTSSSTSSLRRRRLMEIAEEEEEEQRASKRRSVGDGLPETAGEDSVEPPKSPVAADPPVKLNTDLANLSEESKFSESLEPPEFIGARPPSPSKSVDEGRRMSSQSSRPEIYSSASYTYGKPRVKLAPRPSLDVGGHPRTAAVGAAFRPISQLPSGFKLFSKGAKKGKSKENTLDPSEATHIDETTEISLAATAIPLPDNGDPISQLDELVRPHTSSGPGVRPTTSSGASVKSAMPSLTTTTAAKQTMTPEKARLMKAMQLREKKKKMSIQPPASVAVAVVDGDVEAVSKDEIVTSEKAQPTEPIVEEITEQTLATEVDDGEGEGERRLSISKADSGFAVDASSASVHTDVASEITQSDSHPASPIIASSEPDHSTKASSLSEATDETVKETDEELHEPQPDTVDAEAATDETPKPVEPVTEPEVAAVEEAVPAPQTETEAPEAKEPEQAIPTEVEVPEVKEPDQPTPAEIEVPEVKEPEQQIPTEIEAPAVKEPESEPMPTENEETPAEQVETIESEKQDAPIVEQPIDVAKVEEQSPEEAVLENAEAQPETQAEVKEDEPKSPISLPISKFSTSPTQEKPPVALPLQSPKEEEEEVKQEEAPVAAPAPAEETPISPTSPTSPQSAGWKVPRSKFSTQDLRAAASETPAAAPLEDAPKESLPAPAEEEAEVDAQSADSERSKRKTLVEPIRTDLDVPEKKTDPSILDDEELMNELDSATVQQAQHVTVSKSPITPVFPSPPKEPISRPTSRGVVRTISNPIRGNLLTPADVAAQDQNRRSISSGAAFLHKITQQQNQNLAPKQPGKIGSSISQRIKALEKLSANAPGVVETPESNLSTMGSMKGPRPSSAFFAVKRGSVRDPPSRSPSVMERTNSLRVPSPSPSQVLDDGKDSSPESTKANRGRSGSMANRLSMFEMPGAQPPRGRPESISVTARIIRDPSQVGKAPEPPKDPSEFGRLELKESPLVVDHQRAEAPMPPANLAKVEVSKETIQERRLSKEKRRSQTIDIQPDVEEPARRSSLSIMKDFIKDRRKSITSPSVEVLTAPLPPMSPTKSPSRPPSTHNSGGFTRRLSISSRRSSISKENAANGALSPSMYTEGSASGDDSKSTTSDKKKGRASRFMRRLSSSLSSAGRSKTMTPTAISPTVQEEEAAEVTRLQQPTIDAFMGDVNVQFPDNLLWKRRSLCLDSQGFLILNAVAGSAVTASKDRPSTGVGVKRYHLSEFRTPYIPDVELQELPNSVVLDFIEGSGLQVACEDRAGQLNVLHILQDAHQSHTSFGQ
ncbi:gpi-anchored cell surface glycoprotein [Colletotrichum karsti]|uniref:Gpi-anchored cell surface glycoprotein n=1 Tax=Colletotrichum karsti TaxID=1095194 RepID=A0A9P6I7T4_9PEZI|nr:gpi-anchored cell surface glycoprotein [Colletotrichum karsti]KAF9877953.1 gpi-anchored cell surface glycoprotein [Colletotrichum karsti]